MIPVYYDNVGGKWPYRLTRPYTFHLLTPAPGIYHCLHQGNLWGVVNYNYVTLQPGYSIDGATCAITFKSFMPAIYEHDFVCQFCHDETFRRHIASRIEGDRMFLRTMREYGRWPERLVIPAYYAAVRAYGATQRPRFDPDLHVVRTR